MHFKKEQEKERKNGINISNGRRTLTSVDIVQPESTSDCTSEFQSLIDSIRKIEKKRKEEKYNFTHFTKFSDFFSFFYDGRLIFLYYRISLNIFYGLKKLSFIFISDDLHIIQKIQHQFMTMNVSL